MQRTIENVGGEPTKRLILFGHRIHVKNVPLSVIFDENAISGTREKACEPIVGVKLSLAKLEI